MEENLKNERSGCEITLAEHNENIKLELPRLGNPWTVQGLHKLVKEQAPKVRFLMETRLDKDEYKKHCKELPFQNKLIVKKPDSGGV